MSEIEIQEQCSEGCEYIWGDNCFKHWSDPLPIVNNTNILNGLAHNVEWEVFTEGFFSGRNIEKAGWIVLAVNRAGTIQHFLITDIENLNAEVRTFVGKEVLHFYRSGDI